MNLSHKTEYAIRSLIALSGFYESGKIVPLTDISGKQDIPSQYLEQIMLILKGAGYVDSKRGTGGGFFLIKHPQEITLGEIVRLMKGVPESSRRSNKENKEEVSIVLEKIWNEVTQAVDNIIDTITLWDIFQRKEELREQRTGYTYQI